MKVKEYNLQPDPRVVEFDNTTKDIYLQVHVGNGQAGGNLLIINDTKIPSGNLSNKVHITEVIDASGKNLKIITNVLDINQHTNNCVITTHFTDQNGQTLLNIVDKGEAEAGGVASFNGNYIFRLVMLTLICNILFAPLRAQNTDIDFEDLEMPTAPGFILYDETIESIERPTTPQGLAVSGLNAFQEGGAFEFSPFWLFDHPEFTAARVTEKNSPLLSQLSLSIAYIDQDSFGSIALGAKTRVFQMYNHSMNVTLDSILNQIYILLSGPLDSLDTNKIAKLRDAYNATMEHPLVSIDIAAAFGGSSISNSIETLNSDKWGIWVSASFRPKENNFYITALTRLSQNIISIDYGQDFIFDFGGRANYEFGDLTVSTEILLRYYTNCKINSYDRYAIIGSFKLTEGIYFTGSIGKNFDVANNLFALGGITFGISKNSKNMFNN